MDTRIVKILSNYFLWPVGSFRPASYAIPEAQLAGFRSRMSGHSRLACDAESRSACNANLAGPRGEALTAEALVAQYRDDLAYTRCLAKAGVAVEREARN